ncbi:metal ABC transporter permease [Staphylococcus chromogenes]|nr:metal ABC transporter permease [Staphylococcus chromogenes]
MSQWWALNHLSLVEVIVVGLLAGGVGVLATLHRRIFFAEAISHATFPGAVLGVVLGAAVAPGYMSLWLFGGALVGCLVLAAAMHFLARVPGLSSQSAAGIVLSVGFAMGYFWATWFKPLPIRVESFLTGSVLTVNVVDVVASLSVLGAVLVLWWALGPALVSAGFDRASFRATGQGTKVLDALLLGLISATMVVVIPAMGTIVAIALVAAPAATLQPFMHRPGQWLLYSALLGALLGLCGLMLAHVWGLSAGGLIAVSCGICYVASSLWARSRGR